MEELTNNSPLIQWAYSSVIYYAKQQDFSQYALCRHMIFLYIIISITDHNE